MNQKPNEPTPFKESDVDEIIELLTKLGYKVPKASFSVKERKDYHQGFEAKLKLVAIKHL